MKRKPRAHRKSERGTTVLIVVMVTTLITAIGVFAVRNIAEIDRAVGYGRQAAQTVAFAELGSTAAMAQVGATGSDYVKEMGKLDLTDPNNPKQPRLCWANHPFETVVGSSCFKISQDLIEGTTTTHSGETLLEPTIAGLETGSFGPLSNMTGEVSTELTERRATHVPSPGSTNSFDVTVTTRAAISPIPQGTADPCGGGAALVAVTKVLRAHVVIPADLEN